MAKGQKRSNREVKKPKQPKPERGGALPLAAASVPARRERLRARRLRTLPIAMLRHPPRCRSTARPLKLCDFDEGQLGSVKTRGADTGSENDLARAG